MIRIMQQLMQRKRTHCTNNFNCICVTVAVNMCYSSAVDAQNVARILLLLLFFLPLDWIGCSCWFLQNTVLLCSLADCVNSHPTGSVKIVYHQKHTPRPPNTQPNLFDLQVHVLLSEIMPQVKSDIRYAT